MKRVLLASMISVLLTPIMVAQSQPAVFASLNHDSGTHITTGASPNVSTTEAMRERPSKPLREGPLGRAAARALFVHSNLERARTLASQALQQDPSDAEALFVRMEVAAIQADEAVMLNSAVRLCELDGAPQEDVRVQQAVLRLREAAANTPEFRKVLPRVQAVLAKSGGNWPELNLALLTAAMDGVPGLDPASITAAAGILTDWRVVGPIARSTSLDVNAKWAINSDDLHENAYLGRSVENFHFVNGMIVPPSYLAGNGAFYATASFASFTERTWTVQVQTATDVDLRVDGTPVLHSPRALRDGTAFAAIINVGPGPHHVAMKFAAAAAPIRVSVLPASSDPVVGAHSRASLQELAYGLAAQSYASGAYRTAIEQIDASPTASDNLPLQYLRAESLQQKNEKSTIVETRQNWTRLLAVAPAALSANAALARLDLEAGDFAGALTESDVVLARHPANVEALEVITAALKQPDLTAASSSAEDLWARRLMVHSSCSALQEAVQFYDLRGEHDAARAAEQRLDGCAPESLAYAAALAEQGKHKEAAGSLQRLIMEDPTNRSARFALIREMQLAGDDRGAQEAAAEWLHIAPNALSYRRLAAANEATAHESVTQDATPFYAAYRRDAQQLLADDIKAGSHPNTGILLYDHVAIARSDGSVSLYVHVATRVHDSEASHRPGLPAEARLLQARLIEEDGSAIPLELSSNGGRPETPASVSDGFLDEEYVIHYAGDGGIAERSEVFQFVFGSFGMPIKHARFAVLTPANQGDQGVVIATGDAPRMTSQVNNGILARLWTKDGSNPGQIKLPSSSSGMAIVRVVEQDNGWSVPRNAERQRKIETIHPGPKLEES